MPLTARDYEAVHGTVCSVNGFLYLAAVPYPFVPVKTLIRLFVSERTVILEPSCFER